MPTLEEKEKRIRAAMSTLEPILDDEKRWANECESAFSEFRVATIHLSKERDTLDSLEKKQVVWKYLCRLSKGRRPYWVRCEEVLNILMGSDAWLKAFVPDDDVNVDFLPTNIQGKFIQRLEEVGAMKPRAHVRLVIIGCNEVAQRHVSAILRYNTAEHYDMVRVVGLCDEDENQVAAIRALLPADANIATAASLDALETKAVDFQAAAVCSLTSRSTNIPKLLNKKKYIFVESPLALTFDLTRQLAKDANAHLLYVAESAEVWPVLSEVQELMSPESGKIGDLVSVECHGVVDGSFAEAASSRNCGPAVIPGLHWVRALEKLLGPIKQAFVAAPKKCGNVFAAATLSHEFGHVSTMQCRQYLKRPAPPQPSLVISGTLGEILVEGDAVTLSNADQKSMSRATSAQSSGGYASAGNRQLKSGSQQLKSSAASKASDDADPSGEALLWKGFSDFCLTAQLGNAATIPEYVRNSIQLHLKDWAVAMALNKSQGSGRYESV